MKVEIRPEYEPIIREKVQSGAFKSPEDVVGHALHMLVEAGIDTKARIDELVADVSIGIDDLDRGHATEWSAESLDEWAGTTRRHVREELIGSPPSR